MFSEKSTAEDRLQSWRTVRRNKYSLTDILEQFATIPVQPRYIDYYTPSSWPNVFEIVAEGMTCYSGISLVLAATLHYKGFISSNEITFLVISNNIDGTVGLVPCHDDSVYNFIPGKVATLEYVKENAVIYDRHTIDIQTIFS